MWALTFTIIIRFNWKIVVHLWSQLLDRHPKQLSRQRSPLRCWTSRHSSASLWGSTAKRQDPGALECTQGFAPALRRLWTTWLGAPACRRLSLRKSLESPPLLSRLRLAARKIGRQFKNSYTECGNRLLGQQTTGWYSLSSLSSSYHDRWLHWLWLCKIKDFIKSRISYFAFCRRTYVSQELSERRLRPSVQLSSQRRTCICQSHWELPSGW